MSVSVTACREKALSLVGQGYIYGAKGQICSPAFRRQQTAQYPAQASMILGTGAKWDGKPVWDCAQLTRAVAKVGGVELPSGATSQWRKGAWVQKGTIDTLPKGMVCFLYRQDGNGTMQHTGVSLGDGTVVDARGTKNGVLRGGVGEYPWTHWAVPWKEDGCDQEERRNGMDYTGKVCRVVGGKLAMRTSPGTSAPRLAWLGDGAKVYVAEHEGEWCRVALAKECEPMGWCMGAYLEEVEAGEQGGAACGEERVTLTLRRCVVDELLAAIDEMGG